MSRKNDCSPSTMGKARQATSSHVLPPLPKSTMGPLATSRTSPQSTVYYTRGEDDNEEAMLFLGLGLLPLPIKLVNFAPTFIRII